MVETDADREAKGSETDAKDIKARVHRYYHAATEDYIKYYQSGWHHHMHYGFDRDLPRGGNPTEHMVRYLAGLAAIGKGDRVLDAGCGVGGSGIFLARSVGCRCVGITLVESQAKLAKGFAEASARRHPGTPEALFSVNDFHLPAFKPESFDIIWAVESFDHAVDKAAWVASMFAILKPGGRLVIADGFRAGTPANESQAREYRAFLAGWAVPHLCTPAEMESYGARAGFRLIHGEDISADVMPHARAIFRFGLIFIPLRWLLAKLGLTSPEKLGNAYATYFQYRTLKQGLWSYRAFCFRKPA